MPKAITYRQHACGLLVLGLPLVGSHLAQIAIGMTDNLMLGRYSVEALAAVTLSFSFSFVIFIVGSGFAFAVMPMVASAVASGDETQIRRVTRMGLWISAIYGLCVLPLMIWSDPVLRALGQEPGLAADAQSYLAIFALGMIPSLLVMVLKSYLSALERTQAVLWITVAGAVLNAGLNYVLIFGNLGAPELGLRGAAIASVSMQLATLVALIVYTQRHFARHQMFRRFWRADWDGFSKVFRLGWPIGLTMLAESGMFSASALMMGWLGALPLAAHGIALQLAAAAFVVHLGISQAATVRTGHALGRDDRLGLRDGARTVIALSVLFAAVAVVLFLTVPEHLLGLFLSADDPDRPAILAIGVGLLAIGALFQLVDAMQVVALGLLRGIQDTQVPMLIAGFSYWGIGLTASYVCGFVLELGGQGVWLGLVFGLAAASTLLMWRFWTHKATRARA